MSQFEQLERYKDLLDKGIINEEEFRKIKKKILGLKSDEETAAELEDERAEALAEIEKMRDAAKQEVQQGKAVVETESMNVEEENASRAKVYENYQAIYSAEMAKERARQAVYQEYNEKEKQEKQKIVKATANFVIQIILWGITAFLALWTAVSFSKFPELVYIITGIISFVLTLMVCPLVTKKTRHIEKLNLYYEHKKAIVVFLVVAYFAVVILLY